MFEYSNYRSWIIIITIIPSKGYVYESLKKRKQKQNTFFYNEEKKNNIIATSQKMYLCPASSQTDLRIKLSLRPFFHFRTILVSIILKDHF